MKTLDRMCAGCIYGRTPDAEALPGKARLDGLLRHGDTHTCHRSDLVNGPNSHVCRGFIEVHRHGSGASKALQVQDAAAPIDAAWDADPEAVKEYWA